MNWQAGLVRLFIVLGVIWTIVFAVGIYGAIEDHRPDEALEIFYIGASYPAAIFVLFILGRWIYRGFKS